jgi:hypothetical protein
MPSTAEFFGTTYDDARNKFRAGAKAHGARSDAHVLEGHKGAQGEALSIDTALLGPANAPHLLVMTSATHGPEGFCGSGSQVSLLHDIELRSRLEAAGVALLLIHAVNPYGFSHLRRVNEDNIDLNRNGLDFAAGKRPANPGYAELHELLLPKEWPPSDANRQALADFIRDRGEQAYQFAVSLGQYDHPDGMFYGGAARSWSLRTVQQILQAHGRGKRTVAWIDMHTALGPRGHAEKIHTGAADELPLARQFWGADLFSLSEANSKSAPVSGSICLLLPEACPDAQHVTVALEYGTLPIQPVLNALRGDHWLHRRKGDAPAAQIAGIKQAVREAFYGDADDWRGMVLGQARTAVLQAVCGLQKLGG